jgi:sec-independent protein translocase protein TatC
LLVKLGMVTTEQLRQARRFVIVGAFIVAAVLTPPDVISQFMLAIPLCLLYELGIVLSGFIAARSARPADLDTDPAGDATPVATAAENTQQDTAR